MSMSYPPQEGYGQYDQGFYESGLTIEAEGDNQAEDWQQQGYGHQQQAFGQTPVPVQWGQTGQQYVDLRHYNEQEQGYTHQSHMDSSGLVQRGREASFDTGYEPGSMGHMETQQSDSGGHGGTGFEDEPPLLEELGINITLIKEKTLSVLNPLQQTKAEIMNDTDLAGPLMYCLLFGVVLLLSGKVHFGYIYGVGLLGCSAVYVILTLMSVSGVSVVCVVSVLGYCLLPMVLLSCFSLIVSLQAISGSILTMAVVVWCSFSASKLFASVLSMDHQQWLVAYPCAMLYGVFALLTVF